jgi:putative sterol carrier protein
VPIAIALITPRFEEAAMAGELEAFFEGFREPRHVPLLKGTSGTLMLEIKSGVKKETERWYVTIHKGEVQSSPEGSHPDAIVRTDRDTLDALVAGKMTAAPAMLRGLLEVEGKVQLLVAVQALFLPSAGAADQRVAGYARRRK